MKSTQLVCLINGRQRGFGQKVVCLCRIEGGIWSLNNLRSFHQGVAR